MRFRILFLLAAAASLTAPAAAPAQSLQEALVAGYLSNPTLLGERAALRALDENIAQSLAGWRPNLSLNGSYGYSRERTSSSAAAAVEKSLHPAQAQLQLRQNLYQGGQTQNTTLQAEQQVQAGQARLDMVEQQVLLEIVTAYFNVTTARDVVALGRSQVRLLARQLQAVRDRFEVGEITRTDVAQAEARLAQSRSGLSQSERELADALAEYVRTVGAPAGTLETSPPLPPLPASFSQAQAQAAQHSPLLRSAEAAARAASHGVDAAKGALLPSLDLNGQYQYGRSQAISGQRRNAFSLTAQLTVPLYQSGAAASRIRQTMANHAATRMDVAASRRLLQAQVRGAWERLRSVRSRIASDERQVAANEIAFEGILREAEAGLRTTLDILDGEQELFDARVALTRSRGDEYAAAYALLQAMGRMSAEDLRLPVELYRPEVHSRQTRARWHDFDYDADME